MEEKYSLSEFCGFCNDYSKVKKEISEMRKKIDGILNEIKAKNEVLNELERKIDKRGMSFGFSQLTIAEGKIEDTPYWVDGAISYMSSGNSKLKISDYSSILVLFGDNSGVLYTDDHRLTLDIINVKSWMEVMKRPDLIITKGYVFKNRYGNVGNF